MSELTIDNCLVIFKLFLKFYLLLNIQIELKSINFKYKIKNKKYLNSNYYKITFYFDYLLIKLEFQFIYCFVG